MACVSEDLNVKEEEREHSVLYLLEQSQGHHTIDRLEERDVEIPSSLKRPYSVRRHWNCFKGNVGTTSERRDRAHMGFHERIDAS